MPSYTKYITVIIVLVVELRSICKYNGNIFAWLGLSPDCKCNGQGVLYRTFTTYNGVKH